MKNNYIFLLFTSIILVCVLCFCMISCSNETSPENLMENITPNKDHEQTDFITEPNEKIADFSLRLFKITEENDKNTLISPVSVVYALALSANGADNNTLAQMEKIFGMDMDKLNPYLSGYMTTVSNNNEYRLNLANSIWVNDKDGLKVNNDFLQKNADYYNADIFKAPFSSKTADDINEWIYEKTDKMIPKVIDNVPDSAVMYLVNALAFEAEWIEQYEKHQITKGKFTNADGKKQDVEYMCGEEHYYLEDDKATGFIKSYTGRKFAFLALLPKDGITISDYVKEFNAVKLNNLITNKSSETVKTMIPKFEVEYKTELSRALSLVGMTDAFDVNNADFSALGTSDAGNIFISRILHNTYISVGEQGTRAGAATVVEKCDGTAMPDQKIKEVYLDRPFIYMIIDLDTNTPLFIGTLNEIE